MKIRFDKMRKRFDYLKKVPVTSQVKPCFWMKIGVTEKKANINKILNKKGQLNIRKSHEILRQYH